MSIAEELRALQKEWRKRARKAALTVCRFTDFDGCADDLTGIISRVEEHERELAALKEPMECGHPKVCLRHPPAEHWGNTANFEMRNEGCSTETIHYPPARCAACADLREVAEMAIRECMEIEHLGAPIWPSASDIVRRWREKKAQVRK